MSGLRLRKDLNIRLNGRDYIIEQRLPNGMLQIRDIILNEHRSVEESFLIQEIFNGNLVINENFEGLNENKKRYMSADFSSLPEDLKQCARRKHLYISKYLTSGISRGSREQIQICIKKTAEEISDPAPPSVSTFYRWLFDYEASGRHIWSLIPSVKSKGNRTPKISPDVKKTIKKVIQEVYLTPERPTGADVYDKVIVAIHNDNQFRSDEDKLPLPSISTVDSQHFSGQFAKRLLVTGPSAIVQGIVLG